MAVTGTGGATNLILIGELLLDVVRTGLGQGRDQRDRVRCDGNERDQSDHEVQALDQAHRLSFSVGESTHRQG